MIDIIFGVPGCGKSTECCKLVLKERKNYDHFYINFPHSVPDTHICDLFDLGKWTFPPGSLVIIDEASIEYNSRSYKSLPSYTIAWFKLHRHYDTDLVIFSQAYDDMDITLRRLAVRYWLMKKIGPFTLIRRIYKFIGIDDHTHQLCDMYRFSSGLWAIFWPLQFLFRDFKYRLTFRPFYYRYFDSWSTPDLPVKDFPKNPPRLSWIQRLKTVLLPCRHDRHAAAPDSDDEDPAAE